MTTIPDAAATNTYGNRYVFARLDQQTLSANLRTSVSFTPTMSGRQGHEWSGRQVRTLVARKGPGAGGPPETPLSRDPAGNVCVVTATRSENTLRCCHAHARVARKRV